MDLDSKIKQIIYDEFLSESNGDVTHTKLLNLKNNTAKKQLIINRAIAKFWDDMYEESLQRHTNRLKPQ